MKDLKKELKHKFHPAQIILLVFLIIFGLLSSFFASRSKAQEMTWEVRENFGTTGFDVDFMSSLTVDDNYLYLVGNDCTDASDMKWQIERRKKQDGLLPTIAEGWSKISSNPSNDIDKPYSITADNDYLYIVGSMVAYSRGRIEKRKKSDGSLVWAQEVNNAPVYAITTDNTDSYIYTASHLTTTGAWLIEKRFKSDGTTTSPGWTQTSTYQAWDGTYFGIKITADETHLYIAGNNSKASSASWGMEKRDKSNGNLVSGWPKQMSDAGGGYVASIIADGNSSHFNSIYTAGTKKAAGVNVFSWEIRRLDKDGNSFPTVPNAYINITTQDWAYAMTADQDYLYIVGTINQVVGDPHRWGILKLEKFDLDKVWFKDIDKDGESSRPFSVTNDNDYIYTGGYDCAAGLPVCNPEWLFEARRKSDFVPPPPMTTYANAVKVTVTWMEGNRQEKVELRTYLKDLK